MMNTQVKIKKNEYKTLCKNTNMFKKLQEEYLNSITRNLMTTKFPKWGGLKVSIIN